MMIYAGTCNSIPLYGVHPIMPSATLYLPFDKKDIGPHHKQSHLSFSHAFMYIAATEHGRVTGLMQCCPF